MADQKLIPASSTSRALLIIGDARVLQILRTAFRGAKWFGDWADEINVPRPVLVDRLERLIANGVMYKVEYSQRPLRFEYRLTKQGRDLWAYLMSLWAWEKRWVPRGAAAMRDMRHHTCGKIAMPVACCANCSEPLTTPDVLEAPGPGFRYEPRLVPRWQRRALVNDPGLADQEFHHETTQILGNRWSTLLLLNAMRGVTRFLDLQTELGISPNLLASRLREMVDMGIFEKVPYGTSPLRYEYRPTPKGRALFDVRWFSSAWGDRWLAGEAGPPVIMTHRLCGRPFVPVLKCSECGGQLRPGNFRFEPEVVFSTRRTRQKAEKDAARVPSSLAKTGS